MCCGFQTVDKKAILPRRGRIALSANERIAEFLDFAIQAKFAYVNKLQSTAHNDVLWIFLNPETKDFIKEARIWNKYEFVLLYRFSGKRGGIRLGRRPKPCKGTEFP